MGGGPEKAGALHRIFLGLCLVLVLARQFSAVTPNTIRIQSVESPERGNWVVMPGFSELGSPIVLS